MNTGTEPHELPIGVVLSERNKEILLAARALEEVLGRHNLTIADFAMWFSNMGQSFTVDLAICTKQMHEDRHAEKQSLLDKLSPKEQEILKDHFSQQP